MKRNQNIFKLCDQDEYNKYSCVGQTTGSLIRHLKIMFEVNRPDTTTYQIVYNRIYTFTPVYITMNLFICLFSTTKLIHNYYVIHNYQLLLLLFNYPYS